MSSKTDFDECTRSRKLTIYTSCKYQILNHRRKLFLCDVHQIVGYGLHSERKYNCIDAISHRICNRMIQYQLMSLKKIMR